MGRTRTWQPSEGETEIGQQRRLRQQAERGPVEGGLAEAQLRLPGVLSGAPEGVGVVWRSADTQLL